MEESIGKNETLNIDDLPSMTGEEVDLEKPEQQPEEPEHKPEGSIEETPEEPAEEPEAIEEPQDEFKDWDKEKSVNAYRELQRKITQRDKEAREEREARIRLEERLKMQEEGTLKKSEPEPKLERPVEPKMPEGYSEVEAMADPDSIHGRYKRDLDKYLRETINYQNEKLAIIENETRESKRAREIADGEREAQGEFIKLGCTAEKAAKVFHWASQPGTVNYANMLKLYEMEFPEATQPGTKAKVAQIAKQGERHKEVLPPGVQSTETEKPKDDNPLAGVGEFIKEGRLNRQF